MKTINQVFLEIKEKEKTNYLKLMEGNFEDMGGFGYFTEMCINENEDFINIIVPKIKLSIQHQEFQNKIIFLEKNNLKNEKEGFLNSNPDLNHPMNVMKLDILNKKINELTFQSLLDEYSNIFDSLSEETNIFLKCTKKNYSYCKLAEILYRDFAKKQTDRFSVPNNNSLERIYQENNIDLKSTDTQYDKYQLLTIDENFNISISNIVKVYDKRIQVNLLINEIDIEFLNILNDLYQKKLIGTLALRPEYTIVSKDLKDLSFNLEEIERGKIFSFDNLNIPSISKLYSSNNYDNNLWINIDTENITFEEIIEDFEINDSNIITQVIHLQYMKKENKYYISHIDHEYIFYTEEEYIIRLGDCSQKGKARQRFKTFKIDNSSIPFILDDGSFFLYIVLNFYFKNKDLLNEYFENVLEKEA